MKSGWEVFKDSTPSTRISRDQDRRMKMGIGKRQKVRYDGWKKRKGVEWRVDEAGLATLMQKETTR